MPVLQYSKLNMYLERRRTRPEGSRKSITHLLNFRKHRAREEIERTMAITPVCDRNHSLRAVSQYRLPHNSKVQTQRKNRNDRNLRDMQDGTYGVNEKFVV